MNEHGAVTTYATVIAGVPVTLWATSLEAWLGIIVAGLTIVVLVVRLCVDVPRALKKWKERVR